jgi:F0F1-type ATP synthase assembly protein I
MASVRPDPRKKPPPSVPMGEMAGVGLQFAASILLFLFAGSWLDGRLGTGPWLMVAGVFVGGAAGFYSMYRRLVIVPRDREAGSAEEEAGRR